jgi:hypothetical protein
VKLTDVRRRERGELGGGQAAQVRRGECSNGRRIDEEKFVVDNAPSCVEVKPLSCVSGEFTEVGG